ncbi:hypothetical protein ACHRVZ_15890 [Flavobacterium sp. FlaQc-57]|uniref:hypothetical protein n=1 Tax=Flavobacterium sp. FlaQc-57 TaxID=3374186 RepID=UPI003757F640
MKTLSFKNMLPFGVVVLAVSGAFVTTSMQSAVKTSMAPESGYAANAQGQCDDLPIKCDSTPKDEFCHVSGTSGPLAYRNQSDNCIVPLYKPD